MQEDLMFVCIGTYGFYQLLAFRDAFSRLPVHHEPVAQQRVELISSLMPHAPDNACYCHSNNQAGYEPYPPVVDASTT